MKKTRSTQQGGAEPEAHRERPRGTRGDVNMAFLGPFSRHWRGVVHITRHRSHSLARTLCHSRGVSVGHHGQEPQRTVVLGARSHALAHPRMVSVRLQELIYTFSQGS